MAGCLEIEQIPEERLASAKKLNADDIDAIYDAYPESGGYLIEEVVADVKSKQKTVKNARSYILGYAKKVQWDDNAEHFASPWDMISDCIIIERL